MADIDSTHMYPEDKKWIENIEMYFDEYMASGFDEK